MKKILLNESLLIQLRKAFPLIPGLVTPPEAKAIIQIKFVHPVPENEFITVQQVSSVEELEKILSETELIGIGEFVGQTPFCDILHEWFSMTDQIKGCSKKQVSLAA